MFSQPQDSRNAAPGSGVSDRRGLGSRARHVVLLASHTVAGWRDFLIESLDQALVWSIGQMPGALRGNVAHKYGLKRQRSMW